jgi:hypothetical protein
MQQRRRQRFPTRVEDADKLDTGQETAANNLTFAFYSGMKKEALLQDWEASM